MSEVNSGKVYLTRERLIEMERELKELKSNGRKDMAQKIAESARLWGLERECGVTMLQRSAAAS